MNLLLSSMCSMVLLIQGIKGAQWSSSSPQDGLSIYACVGDSVTLAWRYLLATGDALGDTEWLFDGHSQEIVAISTHGNFFPTPPFSQRVEATDNAGIVLRKVTVSDSGNYTVEVNGHDSSGAYFQLRRHVLLHVSDQLMTTDGQLHVTMTSEAVLDPNANRLSIELTCGTFPLADNPPFAVQWVTPSGHTLTSSGFHDHHFYLYLPASIEDGNYTCRVPQSQAAHACLQGNGTEGQVSVYVSKADTRFAILEKMYQVQQQTVQSLQQTVQSLQMNNATLQQTVQNLQQTVQDLQANNATLQQTVQNLQESVQSLQAANATLQRHVANIENRAGQQVAFHVTGLQSGTPPTNTPLIFSNVHYNIGQAYNPNTGYVVAPSNGVYFVIVTIGAEHADAREQHYIYVDSVKVAQGYAHSLSDTILCSAHATIHALKGQKIWVGHSYDALATVDYWATFSGFLLAQDP